MVAQCKTNSGFKTLIYLACFALFACTDPKVTVVELSNTLPADISHIVDRFSKDKIDYDISGKKIIFYGPEEDIGDLVVLLKQLDSKDSQYLLQFSWGKHKRYSTTKLPSPFIAQLNTPTNLQLFSSPWQINLQAIQNNKFVLHLVQYAQSNQGNMEIQSIKLTDGSKVKFRDSANQATTEKHFQVILNENKMEPVSIEGMPKGLHLTLERI